MPVDQELSALATVASLLPTDIIYIVRDPGGVAEADHKAAVSVLDARYPGAVISVFGRTGAVVATSGDYSAGQISGLGTLAVLNSPLAIANGGSGQITQQAAIDALSNVTAATNEHVLTKDTASGNVIFKAAAGGSSLPVADTQTIVKGSADATKLLRFEVDGFTAGATRVMTPPNQDTLLAGQNFANVFTQPQTIQGALAVAPTTNAFGTSSIYTAFVIGNLTGANAANGGLYAVARFDKATEPFTALSGFDEGTERTVYIGGGGWSVPDATRIEFWTAPIYSETNDTGKLRVRIGRTSFTAFDDAGATAFAVTYSNKRTTISIPVFNNGDITLGNVLYANSATGYGEFTFGTAVGADKWGFGATSPSYTAGENFYIFNYTTNKYPLAIGVSDNVGIGNLTGAGILAKLHVSQFSTTAAIPALRLNQADLSEEFIRFQSTVGAGNPIDTAALSAYYGKVRVYVEGVGAKWLALYD